MIENLPDKIRSDQRTNNMAKGYCLDRVNTYDASECKKTLKKRMQRLDNSIDMKFNTGMRNNAWRAKIAMPMVRESYLSLRAIASANFINDPLVHVNSEHNTPAIFAKNMTNVLKANMRRMNFRHLILDQAINSCSRWGVAVVASHFRKDKTNSKQTLPIFSADGTLLGYDRVGKPRTKMGADNRIVHPLNYFQDPEIPVPEYSGYMGYKEKYNLDELIETYNHERKNPNTSYDLKALKMVIEQAKKQAHESGPYQNTSYHQMNDWNWAGVWLTHWYGKLNIKGNEGDTKWYYLQLACDKIIRVEELDNDDDMVPISIYVYDKRPEYWWGNVPCENIIPMEKYMQLFMSMAADEGIRGLQNYIFYDKSLGINPADINARAKNGGFIPFNSADGKDVRQLFTQFNMQNSGIMQNGTYLMDQMKEAAQRVTPKADYSRASNQGGLQNKTAFAANLINEQGDIQNNYYLHQFANGLTHNAEVMAIMLKQHLPDFFISRPDPNMEPVEFAKYQILGDMGYTTKSSLTTNKMIQANKLLNTITAIGNFRGSGDPTWMNANMTEISREWLGQIFDGEIDIEKLIPETPAQPPIGAPQQPGAPQQAPQQLPKVA